jgi:hypothetical protein
MNFGVNRVEICARLSCSNEHNSSLNFAQAAELALRESQGRMPVAISSKHNVRCELATSTFLPKSNNKKGQHTACDKVGSVNDLPH